MSDLILNEPQYKTLFLQRALYNKKRQLKLVKISNNRDTTHKYTFRAKGTNQKTTGIVGNKEPTLAIAQY